MNPIPPIKKPKEWNSLALFEKIKIYRTKLTPNHSRFVDKLEAKKIVKELLGDEIKVAPLVRVLNNPEDVHPSDMKNNWIIKATHGCGWNIFLNEKTNRYRCIRLLKFWNKVYNDGIEVQYKYIPPRFFIEEKIKDRWLEDGIINYKVRCIYGKAIPFITVTVDDKKNFYDFEWNLHQSPQIPFSIPKPDQLSKLIEIAEKLSAPFEFVRMDFYINHENDIYFSEYTFTPSNGEQVLPYPIEYQLGKSWV